MRRIISGFIIYQMFFSFNWVYSQVNFMNHTPSPQIVRVGISDNTFSKYLYETVSVTSKGDFIITDNSACEFLVLSGQVANIYYKNSEFSVYVNGIKVLTTNNKLSAVSTTGLPLSIVGLYRKSKPAEYLGHIDFEISKSFPSSKFAVVNVLPLQTYLKGVVPNEMPVKFGLEALKAQAVLARNYVLKPREKFYKEFDICDSVSCQVYFGSNTHEELSDRAVDETENIVSLYDNNLILAVYSSTAGGYTEDYKNVFMQNFNGEIMSPNIPYLTSVPDNDRIKALDSEEKFREFYFASPKTYDSASPYYRWEYKWILSDLEKLLKSSLISVKDTGYLFSKYPVNFNDCDFFGKFKSIYINKRGASGKIVALTIVTDKNEFTLYKELIIRKVFKYNGKILPSANVFFDIEKDEKSNTVFVIARGCGMGHGVGMSQWGAGTMAEDGFDFKSIIKHYYTGVDIAVLPIIVYENKPVTLSFYIDKKNSELISEKKVYFQDLNIIINNEVIDEDFKKKLYKEKSLDISKFLKKGKNVITYQLLGSRNSSEEKFWIKLRD